jgi:Trypsin-like peptidase domain
MNFMFLPVALQLSILAGLSVSNAPVQAQVTDDSLRVYAVNIILNPPPPYTLYGIYLGRGLIITAAHVVGRAAHTSPTVRIAGLDLPAQAIKEGSFERLDLTLLSVDEEKLPVSVRMRRMPLCEAPPWAGQPVIVAVPEGTARSHIMSPKLLPPNMRRKFPTVIRDVATTGNSGSGVFDAGQKCLLGIMSRKITTTLIKTDGGREEKDIAKYFVPSATIRAFIPSKYQNY